MYSIEKEFKFEYAHRLMHHKGACANIHGHSARIKVEIFSTDVDEQSGMIIDFGHLGFISTYFDEKYDHALILNHEDYIFDALMKQPRCKDLKIRPFQGEPTSENFAKAMTYDIGSMMIEKNLNIKINKIKITFWETAKNCASYTLEDKIFFDK